MDELKITTLADQVKALSYTDKLRLYQLNFSMGYLYTEDLNDRLVLISLLALTYQKLHAKDKSITPLKILLKITGQEADDSAFYHSLEALSILAEDFSYGIKKIDTCGLQNSQDIINKIKELLSTWMPF